MYYFIFYLNTVLLAHKGFSFDFPILFAEVESREALDISFNLHHIHFSDSLVLLRMVKRKTGSNRILINNIILLCTEYVCRTIYVYPDEEG